MSKNPLASAGIAKRYRLDPWVGESSGGGAWQFTQAFLPGESVDRGAGSYNHEVAESDTTKATGHTHRHSGAH